MDKPSHGLDWALYCWAGGPTLSPAFGEGWGMRFRLEMSSKTQKATLMSQRGLDI
jgi:hypothetical protein